MAGDALPREELLAIFLETIAAMHPGRALAQALEECPALGDAITLVALGKAAVPMAEAACAKLGDRVLAAQVVAPAIPPGKPASWMMASHPRPDARSERAGRALLRAAAEARGSVLALVSGGGSALAAVPAPGLVLADKLALVDALYAQGAPIAELNTVRKHLSAIKGGRLAAAARVPVHSMYLSDVVGDELSVIASGPTLFDGSSAQDALAIVRRRLGREASGTAISFLEAAANSLRADSSAWSEQRALDSHRLLLGLDALADHACELGKQRGAHCHRLPRFEGPVHEVAATLLASLTGPGLWVAGGEATIRLPPSPGIGGRAQHLALLIACAIRARADIEVLVAGSDGIDGNSKAAGAIVDGQSFDRMVAAGFDPWEAIDRCDADPALASIGAQICTGPSQVNHADLILAQVHTPGSSPAGRARGNYGR